MRKLISQKSTALGTRKLYLAEDHLIDSKVIFVTEYVQRFYLKDIQALVCHQTNTGRYIKICTLLFALLFSVSTVQLFTQIENDDFFIYFLLGMSIIFAPIFWIVFLMYLFKGKTCETWLYTPVSRVRLYSLGYWRKANKVLDSIRPLIQNAQQEVTLSPEMQEENQHPRLASQAQQDKRQSPGMFGPVGSVRPFLIFFVLMMVCGAMFGSDLFYSSTSKSILTALLIVALFVSSCITLYNFRYKTHLPTLRYFTIVAMFVIVVSTHIRTIGVQIIFNTIYLLDDPNDFTTLAQLGLYQMIIYFILGGTGIGLCFGHLRWVAAFQQDTTIPSYIEEASDG